MYLRDFLNVQMIPIILKIHRNHWQSLMHSDKLHTNLLKKDLSFSVPYSWKFVYDFDERHIRALWSKVEPRVIVDTFGSEHQKHGLEKTMILQSLGSFAVSIYHPGWNTEFRSSICHQETTSQSTQI